MNALRYQGASYVIAVQGPQFSFPPTLGLIPPGNFVCVQVTNYDAILARSDLDPTKFHWGNPQSGQYQDFSVISTPLGPVPEPAAWVAVDATFHGNVFRFIGTHFESVDATTRRRQAEDLRTGPVATALGPVVIAMDSNAQAAPAPQDLTYTDFLAAGYRDVWSEIFPSVAGFTCCQAQFVNNFTSQLYQRVDLILTLGDVVAQNIALFGINQSDKTPDGLWASDHAGVAAQILVKGTPQ